MDLFRKAREAEIQAQSPLANRMRPRTLDEYVGQGHIIGTGRLLRRAIQADQLSSLIFYGPPGTGKTTLATVIANSTQSHFITINAVLSGVKQIREAIEEAQNRRNLYGQRTTLFVDEVHRWNKAQQDALLPHVENGTIILIGATTENPYFEVNKALVSRSRIFQLKPLTAADLRQIALQAIGDKERGYGDLNVALEPEALDHLVDVANGDARGVLNALELAVETTEADEDEQILITLDVAEESIQRRAVLYDKDGDTHYDTISAFIKSLRGSDPDAALYWMAKMVYAGEDPRFIFRRMAIVASEDVGMADPNALTVVISCWQSFERIGLPEGRFPLAQAALYLATCPKSNTTLAFFDALGAVEKEAEADVPNHLKDGNRDSEGFGHGQGYLYPHAYRDHWVAQQYLPESLQGKMFYEPSDQGYERGIRDDVARRREAQLAAMVEDERQAFPEVLTTSPSDRQKEAWLQRAVTATGRSLSLMRDALFEWAALQRHHLVLDLNAGSGLLTWEALRQVPEGGVWSQTADTQSGNALRQQAERLKELERPVVLIGDLDALPGLLELRRDESLRFDRIIGRNLWATLRDQSDQLVWLREHLQPEGYLCWTQIMPRQTQRLYKLVTWSEEMNEIRDKVVAGEETLYQDPADPLVNWTAADIEEQLLSAGYKGVKIKRFSQEGPRQHGEAHLQRWFGSKQEPGRYASRLLAAGLDESELGRVQRLYRGTFLNRPVPWQTTYLLIRSS